MRIDGNLSVHQRTSRFCSDVEIERAKETLERLKIKFVRKPEKFSENRRENQKSTSMLTQISNCQS
ncbi:hypothetical protein T01_15333 [Trichinella spiralis]|uniref:Uncharacterized protein n=1 Tax=Trichinella spiralis TaxID=6334 RepID=A0A0V1AI25_TRISP|nr:hypothetical protein T01_15333 [Trichinella spiralis]